MKKSAQTWSFDLIIAVVLFIVIVAFFYSFLSTDRNKDVTVDLQLGAESIASNLDCDISGDSDVCIIDDGSIDQNRLDDLMTYNYDALKKELGVSGDFCFYLRDKDTGALIPFNDQEGIGKPNTLQLIYDEEGNQVYYCGDPLP